MTSNNNAMSTIRFIKTQEHQPAGEYAPTAIDAAKVAADFVLISCNNKSFSIHIQTDACAAFIASKDFPKRAIKADRGNGFMSLTERGIDILRAKFPNYMTDF